MPTSSILPASPPLLEPLLEIGWIPAELPSPAPFASPQPVVDLARRLRFRRIRGAKLGGGAPSAALPLEIPAALASARAPFAFLMANQSAEAIVAIGTSTSHEVQLVAGAQALLGGPDCEPWQFDHPLAGLGGCMCLVGFPPSENKHRLAPRRSAADLLLDALGEEPFALLVFAAPEPEERLAQALQGLREHAEAIDRTYLQFERQANVDRAALRARELLDRAATHLQQGSVQPLWRASVLVFARDVAAAQRVAGLWLTANHAMESEQMPFRAFACSQSSSGRPPHLNLFTSKQLAGLCPLPLRDRTGFSRVWGCSFDVDHPQRPDDIQIGQIIDNRRTSDRWFGITPETLSRHALITGHTGAGKTTTVRRILAGLAAQEIPFLVFEPAKHEYASLREAAPGVRLLGVTATGRRGLEPLLLNPLAFPPEFPLHTHMDLVRSALTASFGLVPPAPYLVEQALFDAYERRGWDLVSGHHPLAGDTLAFPTLSDLLASVERVVARAGYDGELTRNLRSALLTRLGSLCRGPKGVCFDTPASLGDAELFDRPVIVNLADLGADEEKAFVMGLLLVRLFEMRSLTEAAAPLRHLLVVEESHRLLRRTTERAVDEGNMAHQAIQTFVHLLAEMRAYGQGFLAVEQIPTKLAPEVVKLAGTKIVHRLLPEDDRGLVGSAMGLSEDQRRMLGLLSVGEAVAHSEGMDAALRLQVPAPGGQRPRPFLHTSAPVSPDPETLLGWWCVRAVRATPLGQAGVRLAADGVITSGLASGDVDEAMASLKLALGEGSFGLDPEESARLVRFALEEALLRRATYYALGSAAWKDLREALAHGPLQAIGELGRLLASGSRRHAGCSLPTAQPCPWGYETEHLAEDGRFLADLQDAYLAPAEMILSELGAVFSESCDRVLRAPEAARSSALRRCAAGLAISRWAVSRKTRDLLLRKVEEVRP